ncbi:hypothetical protein ScPMuIL_013418 [Solemya velum]
MKLTAKTESRHGYAVEFSPYTPQRLACATSQYYGIAGCGTLYIFDAAPDGLLPIQVSDWNDGIFDVTWAENNENVVVTGAADGTVLVWDINQSQGPIKALKEHSKEVYSVHWSQTRNEHFLLSASWDRLIKLWDISQSQSLATFTGHDYIVYCVVWSPHIPGCFASASGDKTVRVWDGRQPSAPKLVIKAHDTEVLSCDWSKYDQNVLFSGGVDGLIRGWDIRNSRQPVCQLSGHQLAVRRIKASPFHGSQLASCSYDFTVRLWDIGQPNAVEVIEEHTEFVYGLDYNLHIPGQMVDCGWDQVVNLYTPKSAQQLL